MDRTVARTAISCGSSIHVFAPLTAAADLGSVVHDRDRTAVWSAAHPRHPSGHQSRNDGEVVPLSPVFRLADAPRASCAVLSAVAHQAPPRRSCVVAHAVLRWYR